MPNRTPITQRLFGAYPLFTTDNRDEMAAALGRAYNVGSLAFPKSDNPFFVATNRCSIGGMTLHVTDVSAPFEVTFKDMPDFRQPLVLQGSATNVFRGQRRDLSPNDTISLSPGSNYALAYGGGFAQILVQIDENILQNQLELIGGKRWHGPVQLAPIGAEQIERLRAIAIALGLQLSRPGAENSVVAIELAQALRTAFLFENRAAPWLESPAKAVERRVISVLTDYIHVNWREPLTVEDIARECRVSVRAVFLSFQREYGVSPMAYIRDLRLEHAHRKLITGNESGSVISIALACGFSSFGHFARRYREKFGVLPSETLKKAAG